MIKRDFSELRDETILSQYSASPHILQLTHDFALRIDPAPDIDVFFKNVFDIDTAVGWGLDNWGRILALPREVIVGADEWFGYYGSQLQPWNQAPFFNPDQTVDSYKMSDEMYRKALYYKAAANISTSSAYDLNRNLTKIFPDSFHHVVDNCDMSIRAVFNDFLRATDLAILSTYGQYNRGAGVEWTFWSIDPLTTFGFDGSDLQPFDEGVFIPFQPNE